MKTRLLMLLIGFLSINAFATSLRHIPIKIEREEPMERSEKVKFYGFLDDSSLSIHSSITLAELDVTITNTVTNEVVYAETYSGFNGTSIDISALDTGEYRLQLIVDSVIYLGNFSIY